MSRSRSNAVPWHAAQRRPGGTKASVGSSYQASALVVSKVFAARSTMSGVSVEVPHAAHASAGIGTPHARWREMHQSGLVVNMPVMRSRPHSGIQRTASASETAFARNPSMEMNHWGVARKMTGE